MFLRGKDTDFFWVEVSGVSTRIDAITQTELLPGKIIEDGFEFNGI